MKKLIGWLDNHFLKIIVSLIILTVIIYPKFPIIDVANTWVYIRLEDFLLFFVTIIWLVQVYRKKISLKTPLTVPIIIYLVSGGVSTLWAILFTGKNVEFFPHLALLHWVRRIEYLSLFFLVYTTVKSFKVFKDYLLLFYLSTIAVCFYGLGQRYFRLPAFSTMNEEFSKGIPLYLVEHSRVLSTFAGHYDLAAFLVLMIALFGSLFFVVNKKRYKLALFVAVFLSFYLLLLTFSRVSFGAYVVMISFLILLQKIKWFPKLAVLVIVLSLSILGVKNSTEFSDRFGKMIAFNESFVRNIWFLGKRLPTATSSSELLPLSDELPKPRSATEEAVIVARPKKIVKLVIPTKRPRPPKTSPMPIQETAEEQKSFYVDRSTATRFDAEWPRAIKAFLSNPVFGSGYSTITLATDNDYLRLLGETGLVGFLTFMNIFWVVAKFFFIRIKQKLNKFSWGVLIALFSVCLAMLSNALLIDVFEASKVAITFWALMGLLLGYFNIEFPNILSRESSILNSSKTNIRKRGKRLHLFLSGNKKMRK